MSRNRATGFTLVELLVVVAIIGIISAIAIPNLLFAVDRGKQKRSMSDMRTIGSAVAAYNMDEDNYPIFTSEVPMTDVASLLTPTYLKHVPTLDGWGYNFLYTSDGDIYTVKCYGKDGQSGGPAGDPPPPGLTSHFDDDLIFEIGNFITEPDR
ncbi:MAG: type II secretion system protein GspG [Acidobacteriota bacterium]